MKNVMTLRQHRMSQGLTIRALAEQVRSTGGRIGTQTIVAIEKGRPARMESFRKLSESLGIDLMDIREYRDMVMNDQ